MRKIKPSTKGVNPYYFHVPQHPSKTSVIPQNQKARNEKVNDSFNRRHKLE